MNLLVLVLFFNLVSVSSGKSFMKDSIYFNEYTCTEWLNYFWDDLTLKEHRLAEIVDLERLFILMDDTGDDMVSNEEFRIHWHEKTQMISKDCDFLFSIWSQMEDNHDAKHIDIKNVNGIWKDWSQDGAKLSYKEYNSWWKEKMLLKLPFKGCPEGK